ncbi:hypothetical protein [Niveispirillum fermenti]|uniref:hypothetical protein n=1 Tax=Niveispirillum fermenti TaxID=1233113 RepID=UPI003A88BCF2
MPDISGDMVQGAALALAAAGVMGGIRWLAGGKARQLDGLPQQIHAIEIRIVEILGRLAKAEADIANDKAGRAAIAAMREDLAAIRAVVPQLQHGLGDVWTQLNKLHPRKPP